MIGGRERWVGSEDDIQFPMFIYNPRNSPPSLSHTHTGNPT